MQHMNARPSHDAMIDPMKSSNTFLPHPMTPITPPTCRPFPPSHSTTAPIASLTGSVRGSPHHSIPRLRFLPSSASRIDAWLLPSTLPRHPPSFRYRQSCWGGPRSCSCYVCACHTTRSCSSHHVALISVITVGYPRPHHL
ncbi:hypothetical protein FA13DRAFT_1292766 [Coprinellus micaceus]|uniref:Uncharacterized protein n=1 Tax=Coprinellus micaceus TaxID=71717 RepID=A0A4Y7SS30_COPMI|nr:hypothetical protein FA13DRAFT_1292766 [Coprinellus micaceus]